MKARQILKEILIITVGTWIVAAAVFFFMMPSHVSVGSIAALAMVLNNFLPLGISGGKNLPNCQKGLTKTIPIPLQILNNKDCFVFTEIEKTENWYKNMGFVPCKMWSEIENVL